MSAVARIRPLLLSCLVACLSTQSQSVASIVPIAPIDLIVVDKSDRELTAYFRGGVVRRFEVAFGFGGLEPKVRKGDGRVPEGSYRITAHNPHSAFHKSVRIGYPTAAQQSAARLAGYDPGGDIMIHGLPNGQGSVGPAHRTTDWTAGCIALTDEEIDWLYARVKDGTPIRIRQ